MLSRGGDQAGMAVKRGRESGSDGGEVEYEKLRNERLRENQKRMEELGILSLSKSLAESVRSPAFSSGSRGGGRAKSLSPLTPRVLLPAGPARRSSRLSGTRVISYAEAPPKINEGKEKSVGRKARLAGTGGFRPEIYTEEDEKLLGSSKTEWHLFVDGYVDGNRVYDPILGKTCHQCRQKTLGRRTSCSRCQSLHGQFCGDCLFMRYGENVEEVNDNKNWECPVCRGICNCSFCRLKRGWTPTGSLYRKIKGLGYESVAHYLVLTRRGDNEVQAVEAENGKTPLKPELAVLKAPSEKEAIPRSLENPGKESKIQEKVPEVQSTLLSAGWRSKRAVSTGSKAGEKLNNLSSSERRTDEVDNEAANEVVAEEPPLPKRRGRPPKKRPLGKAAFYGSSPKARLEARPEPVDEAQADPVDELQPGPVDGELPVPVDGELPVPVDGVLPVPVDGVLPVPVDGVLPVQTVVLDSDTEDSSERLNVPETIARRLRRRVTS